MGASRRVLAGINVAGSLAAAHRAIKAGREGEARHLLYGYLQRAPGDYRAWLMLAGVAPSPQDSLECIQRAAALVPGNPTVEQARRWAEERLAAGPESPATTAWTFPALRDLVLMLAAALLLMALVAVGQALPPPLGALRLLLGLAFVLFIPGYALQAAVFSRPGDLDIPARLALSFGLSLALVSLVAMVLDQLPWGIRLWPILIAEGLMVLLIFLVTVLRRSRLPESERRRPGSAGPRRWWASLERGERRLVAIMAGTLLTGLLAAGAILFLPSPADFYTEFFILNPEGLAEAYPRQAAVGEDLSVNVGITNREQKARTYRVALQVENPLQPGEWQLVGAAGPYTLQPGESAENPVGWQMPWAGEDQQVKFLLLMEGQPQPYRSLRLWLDVRP